MGSARLLQWVQQGYNRTGLGSRDTCVSSKLCEFILSTIVDENCLSTIVDEIFLSTIEIVEVVEVIVEVMGVVEVIEVSLLSVEVTSLQKSKSLRVVPHSVFSH